tara:strand:- start:4420 stop:5235 length:816 start_codon:yes stop_codon:yes gene_type:complete
MKINLILKALINSNIFVSSCALTLALSSEILLESSNINVCVFVFFACLFTYNFQRIVRIKKGDKHKRKEWTENNLQLIHSLIIIGAIISIYFFIKFNLTTQIIIIFSGFISIVYPFIIRDKPYCKIFAITSVWTISTMLLLISENNLPFNKTIALHLFYRFIFVFVITIPFDLRDLKYDKKNIKTIPTLLGFQKSKFLVFILLIVMLIISLLMYQYKYLSLNFMIGNGVTCIFTYILVSVINEKRKDLFFSLWIESLSIFYFLFLIISLSI